MLLLDLFRRKLGGTIEGTSRSIVHFIGVVLAVLEDGCITDDGLSVSWST